MILSENLTQPNMCEYMAYGGIITVKCPVVVAL